MASPDRVQRRREQRARLRRRRIAALVAFGGVLALVLALLAGGSGGNGGGSRRTAAGGSPHAARGHHGANAGAEDAAVRRLAAIGLPVYCGGRAKPLVALTYDDGPGPYTKLMIAKLRKHHARATFFLVGKSIRAYPTLARLERPVAALADHTQTHPFLPGLSQSAMTAEIKGARALITQNSGQRVVDLFRPPYGAHNGAVDREARALGMLEVIWTIDSADSLGADYAGISRNVIRGLRPGAIILMHENRGQTIRASLTILPALARKHLRAVTLPELLAQDPPTAAQLRAGPRGCGSTFSGRTGA
ncbi:MAG: hypothetical protein NVSMB51_10710 [Solirubrobacteraceae bacterium]